MTEVTARSLGRNSMYAGILQLWQVASRFVITPLIIVRLGLAGYGTWTLLFGICSYISMFDTSFGFAYMKYTAEYDQTGDYGRLSRIIGSGMALVTVIGLGLLILIGLLRWRLLAILNVPASLLPQAGTAVMIIAACFFLRMSIGSVYQVLAGLQRIDLQYKLTMLSSVLEFGLALLLLSLGRGLVGLAVAHFCGQVTGVVIGRFLCWRLCPALRISPFLASRTGLRQVIALGGQFQVLSFLNTLISQAFRMLLSGVYGVAVLAIYELADKLTGFGKTLSSSILAPLAPAFASLHAGQDGGRWYPLYVQVSRLVAVATALSLGFLFAFADRLIIVWTGQDLALAAWTIRVMVFGDFLVLMTGPGTASLRGRGTLQLEMRYVLLCGVVSAVFVIPVVAAGGDYRAIVVAWVAGSVVGAAWFLFAFSRREGVPLLKFSGSFLLKPLLLGGAAVGMALLLRPVTAPLMPAWRLRWACALEVAVWMPVFFLATGVVFWYAMFSPSQREQILAHLVRWYRGFLRTPVDPLPRTELSQVDVSISVDAQGRPRPPVRPYPFPRRSSMPFHLFPRLISADGSQDTRHFPNGVGNCVFSSPAFQRLMAREVGPSWQQCLIQAETADGKTLSVPVFVWRGRWNRVAITVRPLPFCVAPPEADTVTDEVVHAVLRAVQTPFTASFTWWLPPGFAWSGRTVRGGHGLGRLNVTFSDAYIITLDRPVAEYLKTRVNSMHTRHVRTSYSRGLEVIERPSADLVDEYYELYTRVRAEEQWEGTALAPRFFHDVATALGEGGRLLVMRYRGQVVGGGVLLFDRQTVYYFQGTQDRKVKDVSPHAVLHAWALEKAEAQSISRVNLGTVNPGNEGLLRFKQSWGAAAAAIPMLQWRFDGPPVLRTLVRAVIRPTGR